MTPKTPEEMEAESLAWARQEHAAQREETLRARQNSPKEPFDFARLRELYQPIAVPPRVTLEPGEAEQLEREYYLGWHGVRTLREAAEHIRYLALHDST